MSNIWRVFTRDVKRIAAVPKAWIIVIGIIVTPALYAWVNVLAFWDPYGETSHISVAVANLDEGASSELTGEVNVGDLVVEQMKENDQLGWTFVGQDEAEERVKSGKSYAAIIIPKDFSENLLSITTDTFTQPKITYLVNEKANAVAPKITDVGSETLISKITSNFASVVAKAAADSIAAAGQDVEGQINEAQENALATLDKASDSLADGQASLTSLQTDLSNARGSLTQANQTLDDGDQALSAALSAIQQSQSIAADAQSALTTFSDQASSSYVEAAGLLATISSQSQQGMAALANALDTANAKVGTAIDGVNAVVEANEKAIERLTAIQNALKDDDLVDPDGTIAQQVDAALKILGERNAADQEVIDKLSALNLDQATNGTAQAISDAVTQIDAAIQGAAGDADSTRTLLLQRVGELNQELGTLSGSATGFASAIQAQQTQIEQAKNLLSALDGQLAATGDAVGDMADNLGSLQTGLGTIRTDMAALGSASVWKELSSLTSLNAQQISQFMASPVEVSSQVVYPIDTYGSAMAALFTNLSLWIGAFVLMVILKLEVDDDGVPGLTVRQAYMGRWLLLAVISALQGLLVTVGNLLLGVQTVNAVAFVATGMLIGLSYLSIIYALSVALTHVGKGLCVVLVIMQIPGASGLYPIEMMPSFFQNLYPFFPFTYGIDAMRETISGFYDGHYWHCLTVLAIFVAGSFILGLVLRSHLVNLNRLFNREIAATDILIAEHAGEENSYRLTQVVRSLANRREYRRKLEKRAAVFARHYPRLRRGGLIAGIVMPIILASIPSSDPSVKALVLGFWVAWFLLLFAYLIAIEYIRDVIDDGLEVSALPDSDLHQAVTGIRRGNRSAAWPSLLQAVRGEKPEEAESEESAPDEVAAAPASSAPHGSHHESEEKQ